MNPRCLGVLSADPADNDAADGLAWNGPQVVRADEIIQRLTSNDPQDHGVCVAGARIVGALDLTRFTISQSLLLSHCYIEEAVILDDTQIESLQIVNCWLSQPVRGIWLATGGDLHLRGSVLLGGVNLTGAHIRGQLVLSGSRIEAPSGPAVNAEGLVVGGDLLCREKLEITGELRLNTARIGGELRLTSSQLHNPHELALSAVGMTVEKDLSADGIEVRGTVDLQDVRCKGQLSFNNAKLSHAKLNESGEPVALNAHQIVVDSHFHSRGIKAQGEINLSVGRIGGEVRYGNSELRNPGGVALRGDRLVVGNDLYLRAKFLAEGEVVLKNAVIGGQLSFSTATLTNLGGAALSAGGLSTGGQVCFDEGFTANGVIDLTEARIEGECSFNTATLQAPGTAVNATRTVVNDNMYFGKRFSAIGTVDLSDAFIHGHLSLTSAELHAGSAPQALALDATRIQVGIDLACDTGFQADGGVVLRAARVGRNVDFSNAELRNPGAIALDARDLICRHLLMPAVIEGSKVVLADARVRDFELRSPLPKLEFDMEGMSYGSLQPALPVEERLLWLNPGRTTFSWRRLFHRVTFFWRKSMKASTPSTPSTLGEFSGQPYDQLARSYAQLGLTNAARKVLVERERAQRPYLGLFGRILSYLKDWLAGFGHYRLRLVLWLLALVGVGIVIFTFYPPPASKTQPETAFSPILYTLSLLFPPDFGQNGPWSPELWQQVVGFAIAFPVWLAILLSWTSNNFRGRSSAPRPDDSD